MKEPVPANPATPAKPSPDPTFDDLERASEELKAKIDEQRRKHSMPVNASLGSPAIDADNADGHNDVPDDPDE